MIPIAPKIRVSPLATRNSNSPCWTAFRHWIRNVMAPISTTGSAQVGHASGRVRARRSLHPGLALAQADPLDLAGRGLRQLGEELDEARILVRRQPLFHESLELVGQRLARLRGV